MSNTPQIRFAGFTDAWEQRKLGEISESFEYGLNAAATEYDGKHKYIRITDIDDSTHLFIQDNLTSPDIDFSTADDYLLQAGDVLFARTGASVGKTYIYRSSDGDLYFAGFLIRAKIKRDYDADFVFQNTLTDNYDSYIRITSQRSGQPGVNAQEYANFALSVPCLAEQKKIGAYFTNLDNLITLHQRKCDALQKFKKSMLQKMFPQNGESVPEIRFAGFTDAWEQYKLGQMCSEFQSGDFISADRITQDDVYPVFGGNGLRGYTSRYNHDGVYALIGRQGALCGNMNISYGKAYFTEHAVAVAANSSHDTEFLYYLFGILNLGQYSGQSAQPGLAVSKLITVSASTPKLNEQRQISGLLLKLDHLITLHQRKLETLQKMKKSLLQKMFV